MINKKPINKPVCINFSSGPCTKRPGWSVNSLDNALLGRSHRSKEGKIKLKDAIEVTSTPSICLNAGKYAALAKLAPIIPTFIVILFYLL